PEDRFAGGYHGEAERGRGDGSVRSLIGDLGEEISLLIGKEMELARGEIGEKIDRVERGAIEGAAGGAVAYAGLLTLIAAAVLARAEIGGKIDRVGRGAIAGAAGGAVAYAGLLTLIAAAVLALSLVIRAWASALIVGAVVTVVGMVLLGKARSDVKLKNARPAR